MNTEAADEQKFLNWVERRLETWAWMWKACVAIYFTLGITSVGLSTMAATDAFPSARGMLSVGSAMAVALLGFLRPETRYRNIVRAWREVEVARSQYLYSGGTREKLIEAVARSERLATDDEQRETPGARKPVGVAAASPMAT